MLQDLYCVRSDLGNLLKALGRLDEAKVMSQATAAAASLELFVAALNLLSLVDLYHLHYFY